MANPIRLAITTGDPDGIGTEITSKALAKLGPKSNVVFYLFRSPQCPPTHLRRIDTRFKRVTVNNWPDALKVRAANSRVIVDINSPAPPAIWVETAAKACLHGHLDGLVTAPMSKTGVRETGMKAIGHTEILANVSQRPDLFMSFAGKHFNVVLATGHIPLQSVSKALTSELLVDAAKAALELRDCLGEKKAKLPIALVGLNPHAGEAGMIGKEEIESFAPALKELKKMGIPVEGPLVPDAAFFPENWKKYSVFVAPYHDLGLVPFKVVHGQESGLHITMGLPFVRTSVDHGTAKNIFGLNKANPGSMLEALKWAILLVHKRRIDQ